MSLILQVLFASVIAYCILRLIKKAQEWRRLPRGPWGLPVVGYAPFIRYDFVDDVKALFAKYGKVFTINIYGTDIIMIADVDVLKKAMMRDAFNHRPDKWIFTLIGEKSLISWNGDEWKEQRKFSLRVFKHLGLGTPEIEDKIHAELAYLFKEINSQIKSTSQQNAIQTNRLLGPSAANIINLLLTGERFDFDDVRRRIIDETYLPRPDKQNPAVFGISNYWTDLVSLQKYFSATTKKFYSNYVEIRAYLRKRVEEQKKSYDPDNQEPLDFMQAYLKEIKDKTVNGKFFDEAHLYANVLNFFDAGDATTKDFMEWFLLFLVANPDVQSRMRQEIDKEVGRNKRISMQDKPRLPYSEAVMEEVQRLSSSTPLGIIHKVSEDSELGSYLLPRGTHVILNILQIHMDPDYFPEPEKFKPERYLSADGKFVRNDSLIGFGTGKRSCPGEPIARTIIFIYITSFVQKYIITAPTGQSVSLDAKIDGLSRVPRMPLKCLFRVRD